MRKMLLALVILTALPAVTIAWPQPGTPAPNFALPDTAGVSHSLSDYQGKVVFLFFWMSS